LSIRQPRIYAVTGHTEEQYVKKALASGINHVYSKPVTIENMRDVLREFVPQSPMQESRRRVTDEIGIGSPNKFNSIVTKYN